MEDQGRERRMDGPGHRPKQLTLGVIGKRTINNQERATLRYLGRCFAKLNRQVALIPAQGVAAAVREGYESEGGVVLELETNVIGQADHTLVYPDKRLLTRLLNVYPNLHDRDNVLIIEPEKLNELVKAINGTLATRGIPAPR